MIKKLLNFYFVQEKFYFYSTALSVFFIALSLVFISFNFTSLPKQIPLFYSLEWGDKQLRPLPQLFILPLLSTLIVVANILVSLQLHPSQIVLKRIIYFSVFLVSLIFAITCFKIISIFV